MAEIISLSIPTEDKKIIESVMKMKPAGTSFSKTVRLMLEDYMRGKSNPILTPVHKALTTDSKIEEWKKLITEMEVEDFKKLQRKQAQIYNLINKRVAQCLR